MSDKMYGLVAWYTKSYGAGAGKVTWPVCWRMSKAEIDQTKETVDVQLACLKEEIDALDNSLASARELDSSYGSSRGKRKRTPDIKTIASQERRFREARGRCELKVAEIVKRYSVELFDPLYPIGSLSINNGYLRRPPHVTYEIIVFEEDPSDLRKGDLIKMRATLHGSETDYDDENDPYDTGDDEIQTIGPVGDEQLEDDDYGDGFGG